MGSHGDPAWKRPGNHSPKNQKLQGPWK
jgi:hypothetical protein